MKTRASLAALAAALLIACSMPAFAARGLDFFEAVGKVHPGMHSAELGRLHPELDTPDSQSMTTTARGRFERRAWERGRVVILLRDGVVESVTMSAD